MINKIEKIINLYKKGFGYQAVKVVMKQGAFDKLLEEVKQSSNVEIDIKNPTIFGCPIEIYDKIIVDYYVTQILDTQGEVYERTN